ncbi:MAG: aminodeoxychorismate synthase component I [Dehalococcoidia bacterium]|nr:MAG: aminodeoxychorismate synthase component I [Dehalococcoidia bacterium]
MINAVSYPLIEELDIGLAPLCVFEAFKDTKGCFFLDSGMDPHKLGRYSFIGINPFITFKSRGREITLNQEGRSERLTDDPFNILGNLLAKYRLECHSIPVPFCGGAVGYLSYDLCHFIEKLPSTARDDLLLPESYVGFYDTIIAFDNLEHKAFIISTGFPELKQTQRIKRATKRIDEIKSRLKSSQSTPDNSKLDPVFLHDSSPPIKAGFSREEYKAAVKKAKQYIIDGDIFEVNLSQRFESELNIIPFELYKRLRNFNPAPFACYLGFDEVTVVSASPERFLRLQGDSVETRPIKGTRPRGRNNKQDQKLADELLSSSKDRAENIMIVDLERNDLGRVCRYGSVKVTELAILEVYPTVFHLTSTIVGKLEMGKGAIDLLRATFPGGSITGAPKVRAMDIIDELEPTRRSIYTGSIGYIGFNGNLDLNVAIRTFIIKGETAYFQVGGAVVYDSDPEDEYQETLHKAKAMIDSLRHSVASKG